MYSDHSRLEIILEEMLWEITSYLSVNQLPQLNLISKTIKVFCDKNLKNLLINKVKSSLLDLKSFSVKDLFYLSQVIKARYKLNQGFFITDLGQVYAWGDNRSNQLGSEAGLAWSKPSLIKNLMAMNIIQASTQPNYSFFLTQEGQVYVCGSNAYGQLGLGNNKDIKKPILIDDLMNTKIIQLPMRGDHCHHSLFLTEKGQVYACGNNDYGQLGLGHTHNKNRLELITTISHMKIIQIIVGASHSLFLTEMGQVYGCGFSHNKLFGLNEEVHEPTLIKTLTHTKIIQISAGYYHILFLTNKGQVYVCGSLLIEYGEDTSDDQSDEDIDASEPILINAFAHIEIIQVSAGFGHSLFLTRTGQVYACGYNDRGQLGLGKQIYQSNQPILITALAHLEIIQICAADDHSLFLTISGQVYSCGCNWSGQLGLYNYENRYLPELITSLDSK